MKRKIIALLLAVMLMAGFALPVAAHAETSVAWVKMSSSDGSLHLRKGAGTNTDSVGYVKAGDSIKVYSGTAAKDSEGEEWQKILVDRTGKVGYIKSKYISKSASGAVSAANTLYIKASGGTMNLRSGPGTNYSVAGYVYHGEAIEVRERGATWSKIAVVRTGKVGYVKTQYIKGSTSTGTGGSSSSGSTSNVKAGTYDVAKIMTKTAFGAVNLRKGAGTGYGAILTLSRGARINVESKSGDWYKVVTTGNATGYVHKDYVAFGVTGKTTGSVNFRKGAGTGYGVIRQLSAGTSVTVHSVTGNWAKISQSGTTGYIHINYLSL